MTQERLFIKQLHSRVRVGEELLENEKHRSVLRDMEIERLQRKLSRYQRIISRYQRINRCGYCGVRTTLAYACPCHEDLLGMDMLAGTVLSPHNPKKEVKTYSHSNS